MNKTIKKDILQEYGFKNKYIISFYILVVIIGLVVISEYIYEHYGKIEYIEEFPNVKYSNNTFIHNSSIIDNLRYGINIDCRVVRENQNNTLIDSNDKFISYSLTLEIINLCKNIYPELFDIEFNNLNNSLRS